MVCMCLDGLKWGPAKDLAGWGMVHSIVLLVRKKVGEEWVSRKEECFLLRYDSHWCL